MIQPPTFDENGQYVLDTPEQQLAAACAALRAIGIIPQAYGGQGDPITQRSEMQRIAVDLVRKLDVPPKHHGELVNYYVHAAYQNPTTKEWWSIVRVVGSNQCELQRSPDDSKFNGARHWAGACALTIELNEYVTPDRVKGEMEAYLALDPRIGMAKR